MDETAIRFVFLFLLCILDVCFVFIFFLDPTTSLAHVSHLFSQSQCLVWVAVFLSIIRVFSYLFQCFLSFGHLFFCHLVYVSHGTFQNTHIYTKREIEIEREIDNKTPIRMKNDMHR